MNDFDERIEKLFMGTLSDATRADLLRAVAEMEKAKALHSISLQLGIFIQYWAAKNER